MADNPQGMTDLRPPHLRGNVPSAEQPVYVAPGVDPTAAAYAAAAATRSQQRRSGGLPKYTAPAGGEGVAIPLLNAPFQQGMTMAQQAGAGQPSQHQAVSEAMRSHAQVAGSIVEPAQAVMPGGSPQKMTAASLGITATDALPEEAAKDPHFQSGFGSMLAAAQPQLALKYGVIRNGQRIAPQQLQHQHQQRAGGGGLRAESLQDLQDLQRIEAAQSGLPKTVEEAEAQVADSSAVHSANAGGELKEDEDDKKVKEAIEMMDSFDYDRIREVMNRDTLNNPDQREIIEKRCKPLDITDLIMKNRVSQDVPVVPGKFTITFESMTGEEDLELKRLVMVESKATEVTDRYLLDKFAFMALTVGLKAINSNPVPGHFNEKGEFDEAKFWLKFSWVMKRPLHMLASVGVNHTWFEMRVRQLFVAEKVGNG